MGGVKALLNTSDSATDVSTAELLLKAHQDLGDDIRAHEDEFREIQHLGAKLGATGDVGEMVSDQRPVRNLGTTVSVYGGDLWEVIGAWVPAETLEGQLSRPMLNSGLSNYYYKENDL